MNFVILPLCVTFFVNWLNIILYYHIFCEFCSMINQSFKIRLQVNRNCPSNVDKWILLVPSNYIKTKDIHIGLFLRVVLAISESPGNMSEIDWEEKGIALAHDSLYIVLSPKINYLKSWKICFHVKQGCS